MDGTEAARGLAGTVPEPPEEAPTAAPFDVAGLEHGVLEPVKASAIRKQIDALCLELRPQARGLVYAFAIPDEVLAAPIAV